ncbi:peptidoglycan-binding domain-containing protein [Pelagibius marinus]|uniref:peptidoglycan-binding domain-containing protein n=1 Tax=Pelagibius marinus TaxID=2762760 RepID=UPI0018725F53|nr:peptidoglycan-binding protein [Pelagibius marinus]
MVLIALHAVDAAAAGPRPPAATQLAQAPTQMQTAYVRGVQKELLAHGYRPGPVDGVAGRQTRAAVRAYQRDAGLPVDGVADKRLLDHLKFAQPKVYAFGQPVTGHVLDLQRELAKRNYYLGPHDGLAGPQTYDALNRFQEDAGLPYDEQIDGILVQKVRDAPAEVEADLEASIYDWGPQQTMKVIPPARPEPKAVPETKEKPGAEPGPDFSDT